MVRNTAANCDVCGEERLRHQVLHDAEQASLPTPLDRRCKDEHRHQVERVIHVGEDDIEHHGYRGSVGLHDKAAYGSDERIKKSDAVYGFWPRLRGDEADLFSLACGRIKPPPPLFL